MTIPHKTTIMTQENETPKIRNLAYVMRYADTRCLEFSSALFCSLWAVYLFANIGVAGSVFALAFRAGGGVRLCAWAAAFTFALQFLSINWRWPKLRRVSSFCCCTYWCWVAWNMFMQDGLFMPWVASFWAGVQFWILARRVAIGK